MTLPAKHGAKDWVGRTVVDRKGADIGVCAALLTDTATGVPEWMFVERGDVTLVVPLLDATESGGRVHVTVTRAYADGAPRFGPTHELSRDQEAALYRHYGIEYSTATSESVLPADAHPADPENAVSSPAAAVRRLAGSGVARPGGGMAAAVAGVMALAVAALAASRLRRRTSMASKRRPRRGAPPSRPAVRPVLAVPASVRARAVQVTTAAGPLVEASGRLTRQGASAGAASARRVALDAARRSRDASTAAGTYVDGAAARLAPLLATTGRATWRAVLAGTDAALRVTDAATEAVVAAVPRVTAGTARAGRRGLRAVLTVGAAAEAVPEVVAETGGRLEKAWRRVMGRLSLGLGLGVGYVLGARAGRARYEQITQAAAGLMERPEVQQALGRARAATPARLRGGIDKLSGRASGGQRTSAGTDAPPPDPLIPPATSGDGPIARP